MRTLKKSLLQTLKTVGIFRTLDHSAWRNNKLLILCYHGISLEDEHECEGLYGMSADLFRSRMEILRTGGYNVIPLGDALEKLYTHRLPPRSVAITFDDGLYNFYARAFPILQEYGYPVTMYLTTYYCFRNLTVFPLMCRYMLWKKRGSVIPSNSKLGFAHRFELTTETGQREAGRSLIGMAEAGQMKAEEKDDLIKRLAGHLGLPFETLVAKRLFHLMTPEEVRDVAQKGVDIQLHTHRHRTPLDERLFEQELLINRSRITELTGREPRHYCYPSGVYRPQFLPWLARHDVSSATTCDPGLAHARANPLSVSYTHLRAHE